MDSPDRVAEAAWLHKLGPEAESLFAKGRELEPFVRVEVVDPVVTLSALGPERRPAGAGGGRQALGGALAAALGGLGRRRSAHARLRRAARARGFVARLLHHGARLDRRLLLRRQPREPHPHDAGAGAQAGRGAVRVGAQRRRRLAGQERRDGPRRPAGGRRRAPPGPHGRDGDARGLGAPARAQARLRVAVRGRGRARARRSGGAGHRPAGACGSRRRDGAGRGGRRRGLRPRRPPLRRRAGPGAGAAAAARRRVAGRAQVGAGGNVLHAVRAACADAARRRARLGRPRPRAACGVAGRPSRGDRARAARRRHRRGGRPHRLGARPRLAGPPAVLRLRGPARHRQDQPRLRLPAGAGRAGQLAAALRLQRAPRPAGRQAPARRERARLARRRPHGAAGRGRALRRGRPRPPARPRPALPAPRGTSHDARGPARLERQRHRRS